MSIARSSSLLDTLAMARQIADYAQSRGFSDRAGSSRVALDHLGAVLADSVLQAGLNYRTVVRERIERIINRFPEAATLAGITEVIERGAVSEFLLWKHPEKIERFIRLVRVLEFHHVEDTQELHVWLRASTHRRSLLGVTGIGPKTVDYMCCLVGIDCVAVDRHVRSFAESAGVVAKDYEGLKSIISIAADLLGVSRRDFDCWIWTVVSNSDHARNSLADSRISASQSLIVS